MAQTHYIPINYPPTEEEQLFYLTDQMADLSTDEFWVLGALIVHHCRDGRATTVEELASRRGMNEQKVRAAIHGLLFRKKIQMIPSGASPHQGRLSA